MKKLFNWFWENDLIRIGPDRILFELGKGCDNGELALSVTLLQYLLYDRALIIFQFKLYFFHTSLIVFL